jgi:hypothetical protein
MDAGQNQRMHRNTRPLLAIVPILTFITLITSSVHAQAQAIPEAPSTYEPYAASLTPPALSPRQRLSVERGVADLGGATEQSLLATVLYLTSAATLIAGVSSAIVLFAEFDPIGPRGRWDTAELAVLGSALGSLVVHAITLPLAISVGLNAQRRHQRAREELLLTHITITPFGAALAGHF